MALHTGITFRAKDLWFVLTTESLSWYKDEEESACWNTELDF